MKIMTFNVLTNGENEAGYRQPEIRAAVAAHSPDILCMQEGGDGDFWQAIIADQGYTFSANIPGAYRPSIYSRLPVRTHTIHDWFSPGGIAMTVPYRDGELLVLCVHLPWKVSQDEDRVEVLVRLLAEHVADGPRYVCICGDFNSRSAGEPGDAWCVDYLSRFSGMTAPARDDEWVAATDLVKARGFTDCYRHLHDAPGYSIHNTVQTMRERVPEMLPLFTDAQLAERFLPPAVRIDYVFANAALAAHLQRCDIDTSAATSNASDHAPFIAEFVDA